MSAGTVETYWILGSRKACKQ